MYDVRRHLLCNSLQTSDVTSWSPSLVEITTCCTSLTGEIKINLDQRGQTSPCMHLVVGEDSEDVQLRVWGEALTLSHAGDDSCYEGPVAQTCRTRR